MLVRLILGSLALGAVAAASRGPASTPTPTPKGTPEPGDPGTLRLGLRDCEVGRVDGTTYRAGGGTESRPTIVLLHGEGQVPAEARLSLPPSGSIRVVTVRGRIEDTGERRRNVDPLLQGEPLRAALLQEADELGSVIVAASQRYAMPGRIVVIGLGTSGAIALAAALRGPLFVRAGVGVGGTLTADWIPPQAPADPPRLYKLSYGDAEGFDSMALKLASSRGWPVVQQIADIDPINGLPDATTVQAWLAQFWAQLGLAES